MVDEEGLFAASDFPIPPQDPGGRLIVLMGGKLHSDICRTLNFSTLNPYRPKTPSPQAPKP